MVVATGYYILGGSEVREAIEHPPMQDSPYYQELSSPNINGSRNPALYNPLILILIFGNFLKDALNSATDSGKEKDHRRPFIIGPLRSCSLLHQEVEFLWGPGLACIPVLPQTSWIEWSYTKSLSFNSLSCQTTKRLMRAGVSIEGSLFGIAEYIHSPCIH